MKRLTQATGEQKGRWEDMAGWALDVSGFFFQSSLLEKETNTDSFLLFLQVMERTERERTLLRSENARLKREVELWKMKAQVAESGQQIDRGRRSGGEGGEGETSSGEEEMARGGAS